MLRIFPLIAVTLALSGLLASIPPGETAASGAVTAASIGVTVAFEPCPYYSDTSPGCYYESSRTIYCRRPCSRRTLAHETAHAWERDHLSDNDRAWLTRHYRRLLGTGPWFAPPRQCPLMPTGLCGATSPGERFAEAWAWCRYPLAPGYWQKGAYDYDTRRHVRLCNTIAFLQWVR